VVRERGVIDEIKLEFVLISFLLFLLGVLGSEHYRRQVTGDNNNNNNNHNNHNGAVRRHCSYQAQQGRLRIRRPAMVRIAEPQRQQ
jgi:hypothetical protein